MLAVALGVASGGGAVDGLIAVLSGLAISATLLIVVRPLLQRVVTRVNDVTLLVIAVAGTAACACVSSALGLHLMFGAVMFGIAFPREARHALTERLSPLTLGVLLPVFFFLPGLQVNLRELDRADLGAFAAILVIACAGKFLGAVGPARAVGLSWREAGALGALLNTRGLVELIVLNVGLAAGILEPR